MSKKTYTLTAESVRRGHPDKLCDQIADGILDAYMMRDPKARVAVEVMASNGRITIAGEVSAGAELLEEPVMCDTLERIGGFQGLPLRPILGADSRDGYRNKALLPLGLKKDGSLSLGFYAVNSHRIVDCASCKLQPEDFNRAMEAFRAWAAQYGDPVYDEATHSGRMRRLYLRKGERSGQVLACVVVNGNGLHHEGELVEALKAAVPGLSSVVINSNRDRTNVALGKNAAPSMAVTPSKTSCVGWSFSCPPYRFTRSTAPRQSGCTIWQRSTPGSPAKNCC